MPIGVLTDCLMVLIGALIGCAAGRFLSEETRKDLNILLGLCAMAIGINSIVKVASMAPVIFSVLIGYTIGAFLHLEELLTKLMGYVIRRLPFKETGDLFPWTATSQWSCSSRPAASEFMRLSWRL